jgi:phage-related protein
MPVVARYALVIALMTVQYGDEPKDWKPMPEVGAGAMEILRYRGKNGAFRVTLCR